MEELAPLTQSAHVPWLPIDWLFLSLRAGAPSTWLCSPVPESVWRTVCVGATELAGKTELADRSLTVAVSARQDPECTPACLSLLRPTPTFF